MTTPQIPIKVKKASPTDAVGFAEFSTGDEDVIPVQFGGTGGKDAAEAKANLGFADQSDLDAIVGAAPSDLDTLEEIAAAIGNNANFLDDLVAVSDIVNNLTSLITDQPLSAAQGKVLKDLIDNLAAAAVSFDDSGTSITATTVQQAIEELDSLIGGLTVDHGSLTGLLDDDHPQYHNDTRGDARYYLKTQLDGGQLDSRYYTETELDGFLLGKQDVSEKNVANGYAGLNSSGKLLDSVIPDLAISEYLGNVANEAAMILLSGQTGDWCIRDDTGTVFILTNNNPGAASSWQEVAYPGAPVTSVNGQTGIVTLDADDIAPTGTRIWFTPTEQSKLSGIEAGAKDDQIAGEVPYTPSGVLTATDVQGALDELETLTAGAGSITSVNGDTGPAVSLDTGDVPEGSNLYYTDARVAAYLDRNLYEQDSQIANSTTTFIDYFNEDFTLAHTAKYMIRVNYDWSHNNAGDDFEAQLKVNGVIVATHIQEPKDPGLDQRHVTEMVSYEDLSAGVNTFELEFRTDDAGETAYIRRARLTVERYV